VAGCDMSHPCSGGYCGPFYISRVYWVDAGKPTLPDDDPARKEGKVSGVYISNLNDACFRCLCHVAGCDMSHPCAGGYCGPFYISRVYWVDAGKPTLPDDDPAREEGKV
jgi:hypothetical protein